MKPRAISPAELSEYWEASENYIWFSLRFFPCPAETLEMCAMWNLNFTQLWKQGRSFNEIYASRSEHRDCFMNLNTLVRKSLVPRFTT